MDGMKGQNIKIGCGCLSILLLVLYAIFAPQYYTARELAKRTYCLQALGTWRKLMKMYANDNKRGFYPKELNGNSGIVDEKLLNSLGEYTNVTNTLKDCKETSFSVTLSAYTIRAVAKDYWHSKLTVTPTEIYITWPWK